jgi:hypothetical protein
LVDGLFPAITLDADKLAVLALAPAAKVVQLAVDLLHSRARIVGGQREVGVRFGGLHAGDFERHPDLRDFDDLLD